MVKKICLLFSLLLSVISITKVYAEKTFNVYVKSTDDVLAHIVLKGEFKESVRCSATKKTLVIKNAKLSEILQHGKRNYVEFVIPRSFTVDKERLYLNFEEKNGVVFLSTRSTLTEGSIFYCFDCSGKKEYALEKSFCLSLGTAEDTAEDTAISFCIDVKHVDAKQCCFNFTLPHFFLCLACSCCCHDEEILSVGDMTLDSVAGPQMREIESTIHDSLLVDDSVW